MASRRQRSVEHESKGQIRAVSVKTWGARGALVNAANPGGSLSNSLSFDIDIALLQTRQPLVPFHSGVI